METPPIGTEQPTAAHRRSDDAGSAGFLAADFTTFLTLLTAQMRHQDPLDPADSTEFTAQLATFSGVEQQVRTNDLLQEMQVGLARLGLGEMGGWIGMEARTTGPVAFDGAPVTVHAAQHPLADRAELVVRDDQGAAVQRVPVPRSDAPVHWTGLDATGQTRIPDGLYHLSVESWSGEQLLDSTAAAHYARVDETTLREGAVWLTLDGGQSVPADAVYGLRGAAGA